MQEPPASDLPWFPAWVLDGPLAGAWVYTMHDEAVPLTFSTSTGEWGEYTFTVEAGYPVLRLRRLNHGDTQLPIGPAE